MDIITEYMNKFEAEFNLFGKLGIGGALIGLLLAIVFCFFGYKLVKVFVMIFGVAVGAFLGFALAKLLNFDKSWFLVSIVLGMIIFGVLAFVLYKLGLAVMIGFTAFGIFYAITSRTMQGHATWVIALIFAILVGVATIWAARPIVIVSSSLAGGMGASAILFRDVLSSVPALNPGEVQLVIIAIVGFILAGFGMFIQFKRK